MLRWAALLGSVAVGILSPVIQPYFPHHPFVPGIVNLCGLIPAGVICGLLFTYFAIWGKKRAKRSLSRNEWNDFTLTRKTKISPNTAIYRFALPSESHVLGLPIGQHISIGASIGGKQVTRSYTPISSDDDFGYFDLLIKTYSKGNISKYLDDLAIGNSISVKGPKGNFVYQPNMCKEIGMIAGKYARVFISYVGGTGITPMLQVIKAILKNPRDVTKVSLVFANVTEEDILCREELDSLAKDPRFNVYYVLNNQPPSGNFAGGIGFVSKAMIEKHTCAYSNDSKMLLCGPPPMVKAMVGHLTDLGWPAPNVISKLPDSVFKF